MSTVSACKHLPLSFGVIDTVKFKYRQPSAQSRRDALKVSGPKAKRRKAGHDSSGQSKNRAVQDLDTDLPPPSAFPAPVVMPGSELALDPDYPPQSVQEWVDEECRNEVIPQRNIVYIVPPPKIPKGLTYVDKWTIPSTSPSATKANADQIDGDGIATLAPAIEDLVKYLSAYYHGMEVKPLQDPMLQWSEWEAPVKPGKSKKKHVSAPTPDCIGLTSGKEMLRIQSRPSPDGIFSGQLNQNHLLEVAIDILPDDAYALLMLVHHDLFEDDDDDFCCGRAYGGSRVAVVSTARYRPELDLKQEIDRQHVWPASHCMFNVGYSISTKTPPLPPLSMRHYRNAMKYYPDSPIAAAVVAHDSLPAPSTMAKLSALWLGRICKTASHELGHCFGIDHCVYYACSMQGTASITEDHRQPPYLCPIDLSKVLRATRADQTARYDALLKFCRKHGEDRMFAAYAAWIRALLGYQEPPS